MTTTTTTTDPVAALKAIHRETWAAGDYASVATYIAEVPPAHLLATVGITPGHDVLDVAAGSGNVAVRAALAGARVTALDLVPELLEAAERRAREAGIDLHCVTGDAERLPFGDESFDRVLSVFGVQFAPRHAVAAAELARVCRPGGRIGVVNWTPEGLIGQMFRIIGSYLPKPPDFASPPPLWGSEDHVRALFAPAGVSLEFERATTPFRFPTTDAYMEFFEAHYGPTIKTRERLVAEGRWEECRAELRELYQSRNEATDGTLHLEAEYLLTVACR